jgi:hypothetical protein
MAKKILRNKNVASSVSYRAVCTAGDYRGQKRENKADALRDALKHQQNNISHKVQIEVEQIKTMIYDIENE